MYSLTTPTSTNTAHSLVNPCNYHARLITLHVIKFRTFQFRCHQNVFCDSLFLTAHCLFNCIIHPFSFSFPSHLLPPVAELLKFDETSCTIMAHFLDVIVTVDGFQHGEYEFTLKAMAIIAPSVAFQWLNVYHTAFLEDLLWGHLQTYCTQVDQHGLVIGTPGAA